MSNLNTIQLRYTLAENDIPAAKLVRQTERIFTPGKVRSGKFYVIDMPLSEEQLRFFAQEGLCDTITQEVRINKPLFDENYKSYICIAKLPGVTDDEGSSAQTTLLDILNLRADISHQHIFSQEFYLFEHCIEETILNEFAEQYLCNKLIHHISCGELTADIPIYVPEVHLTVDDTIESINIQLSDEELIALSSARLLALNAEEMNAIRGHFAQPDVMQERHNRGMKDLPTDCELEIIAQTWSEHCKHKEFNAVIEYTNVTSGEEIRIDSLFQTYIKQSTDEIRLRLAEQSKNWLVRVFSDNAGIVRMNANEYFVWKVETHNSPSAIDPYGGAITGILGNNRDPLSTGTGGAKLLFNTNVLCFGSPAYYKPLLTGQLHPKRVFEGVRKGIEDGGNKSGIPTVNGAILFDDRYSGKPLVYCGTGGLLPVQYAGISTDVKRIDAGDLIISIGGRVGKDGIHGATFSSREIDEHSPQSAVQIGSPIVQKLASDFLEAACKKGYVKTTTDSGAGGLSSAVGELATIANGATVRLENVRLKYSGLKPWEIFLSESQERIILAVEAAHLSEMKVLAQKMDVELSVIGEFTNTGFLEVRYNNKIAAYLDLDFLHNGNPKKYLQADWKSDIPHEPVLPSVMDFDSLVIALLKSDMIASREYIIRQYDHEVKGRTIIKPLMGGKRKSPQDAAIMRTSFQSYEGIAIANGIMPKYVDDDPYNSSAGAFDEAIRQIIAVGGILPEYDPTGEIFWSANDNFCVPDSVYHPETNPDGKRKLAQLVQMCQALYDMSTYFLVPMTSGKDSMKNDFKSDGVKISVPPTILYSVVAKIPDVRKTVTSEFKYCGDMIYLIGTTYDELGESEFCKLLHVKGGKTPIVRKGLAHFVYQKMIQAHTMDLLESAHDISDGGMIIALIESLLGNSLGAEIILPHNENLSIAAQLFSESHSRFIVSIKPNQQELFESIFSDQATHLGTVTNSGKISVIAEDKVIIRQDVSALCKIWSEALEETIQR